MTNSANYPTRLQMPFLLLGGMGFCAFFAGIGAFAFTAILLMLPFSSSYTLDGHSATRAEFLAAEWPLLVLFPVPLMILGAVAYALWHEKPWSREAMISFFPLSAGAVTVTQILEPGPRGDFVEGLLVLALAAAIAAWYLYGTKRVRAYYEAIRATHRFTVPSPGANAGA